MAASLSDSDESVGVPRNKKDKTGVSNSHKSPIRAHDRNHDSQCYCVLFKKSGMPKRKYMWHSIEDCTGVRTKRSIKDGMDGPIGSRNHAVQKHKKYENKRKKDMKTRKKQKKIIYSIAKKSGSRREIYKIKNIRKEASRDTYDSSEDWDSYSSLASDSSWDKERRNSGCKEMNKLDHVVKKI